MKNETISNRIKEALKQNKMSQKKLAELTDLTPATISQYVKGIITPTEKNLTKIAEVLNVKLYWLRGYDSELDHQDAILTQNYRKIKRLIELSGELNDLGLEKLITYGEDILDKYRKEQS